MLTGDKEQTAVQISKAAGHFPAGSGIFTLTNGKSTPQVASAINQYLSDLGLDAGKIRNGAETAVCDLSRSAFSIETY